MSYLSEKKQKSNVVAGRFKLFSTIFVATTIAGCSLHPVPITPDQQAKLTAFDKKKVFDGQMPITKEITIYDAMAQAIKYNLKNRQKKMEESLSLEQLKQISWESLPRLTAQAGYSYRTPQSASVSKSMSSGTTTTDSTSSQAKSSTTADLTFSWNILDFGVSYYQAKQESDRALIASELRRKSLHNLMEEVQFAFWKAVGAQQLEGETASVLNGAKKALAIARKVENEDLRSPITSLRYQLSLLNSIRQLEKVRGELMMAKTDLAVLLNLDPSVPFRLVDTSGNGSPGSELNISIEEMENMALLNRPELRAEHYQSRIDALETRKAIAKSLPGLGINIGEKYDDNPFLLHQQWSQAGMQVTWNLIDIFAAKDRYNHAKTREAVGEARRLALHMAVLSQVHIASLQYKNMRRELLQSLNLRDTQERLLSHVGRRAEHKLDDQLTFVSNAIETTIVRVNLYQAYARLQNAKGRLQSTLGLDQGNIENFEDSLDKLALNLRASSKNWQDMYQSPLASANAKNVNFPIKFDLLEEKQVVKNSVNIEKEQAVQLKQKLTAKKPKVKKTRALQIISKLLNTAKKPVKTESKLNTVYTTVNLPKVAPKSRLQLDDPRLFAVQVAGYIDEKMAEKFITNLTSRGYNPQQVITKKTDGKLWHLVWLGRYKNREQAMAVQYAYRTKEQKPAFLATIPKQKPTVQSKLKTAITGG
ncbi:MAG: TolC family protein [Magnetococcales bacterium]|nr:TolC family protein [Magnetococcales bacterium]